MRTTIPMAMIGDIVVSKEEEEEDLYYTTRVDETLNRGSTESLPINCC